ncbi:MAG: sensor histidine kinase, partial [Caldilineaceae bacterium]|nr:sensor histidine kinase [Caldilineaceae bacterium]
RTQLAHEIHDGPMQELTALTFEITSLATQMDEESVQVRLAVINTRLERNIGSLRRIMTTLRPPAVVNFGLTAAIQTHIEDFREQQPEIEVELVIPEEIPALSEEVILAVYRVCQQALYNIVQHAEADQIWVRLYSQDNRLDLEVEDNGVGFTMPENLVDLPRRQHLGIVGMMERVSAIGGEFTVDSAPGQGTRVRLTLPLT